MRSHVVRRFVPLLLGLLAAVVLWGEAAAHALFLDVDGRTVRVEVSGPPARAQLVGRSATAWSPEDAGAILAALRREGLEAAAPRILGGLRQGSAARSCLTLALEGREADTPLRLVIPGDVAVDWTTGEVVWSEEQLEAIASALHDAGEEGALAGLFGLRFGEFFRAPAPVQPDFADGPTPVPRSLGPAVGTAAAEPTPLTPACGECLSGRECTVKRTSTCCTSQLDSNCTLCRVCSPKIVPEQ